MMTLKQRHTTAGFNLLELLLALAVVAALALAITQVYRLVDNSRKVNAAANAALQVYQAGAQYEALPQVKDLLQEFIDHGYLPGNFKQVNPWGGTVTVNRDSYNSFTLQLGSVPQTSCQNLINKFSDVGTASCTDGDPATFSVKFTLSGT